MTLDTRTSAAVAPVERALGPGLVLVTALFLCVYGASRSPSTSRALRWVSRATRRPIT